MKITKNIAIPLLIIFLLFTAFFSDLSAKIKQVKSGDTGMHWGLIVTGGPCIAGDPDRMAGRSGTYWSAAGSWLEYGFEALLDGFYYFNPLFAFNFGMGLGSYESKWSGTGQTFGNPEIMDYRGYNLIFRAGVSNLYGKIFFISTGFLFAPTIASSFEYTGTVKDHKHDFGPGLPWGVYANLGFRIGGDNSIKVPIGFEFKLFNNYCYDYNGYRIIMWSWNGYAGLIF